MAGRGEDPQSLAPYCNTTLGLEIDQTSAAIKKLVQAHPFRLSFCLFARRRCSQCLLSQL